jgi:hypothetical protein
MTVEIFETAFVHEAVILCAARLLSAGRDPFSDPRTNEGGRPDKQAKFF